MSLRRRIPRLFCVLVPAVALVAGCGDADTPAQSAPPSSGPPSTVAVKTTDKSAPSTEATTTRPPDPPVHVPPTITTLAPGLVATTLVPAAAKVAPAPAQGVPVDIVFRDAARGWMLSSGGNCVGCPVPLAATTDGGASWSRVPSPNEGAASSRFRLRASRQGELWLFDVPGSPLNASALWESPDGGITWSRIAGLARISDLAVGPTTAWAVTDACDITATSCVTAILRSNDHGATWHRVETPLSLLQERYSAQLVVLDDEHVILLTQRASPDAHDIVSTDDGGRHWATLTSVEECGVARSEIAAVDSRQLWLACAGGEGGGWERRVIARSDDGGHRWHVALDALTFGYLEQVWANSPSKAYIGQCRGPAIVTTDGGVTWSAAADFRDPGDCMGPVVFTDAQHGYIGDFFNTDPDAKTKIWRTADAGRTWQPVDVN
ncbi:MAG: hypothetical protein ABI658_20465 [Acidimicrobiales bacterium]